MGKIYWYMKGAIIESWLAINGGEVIGNLVTYPAPWCWCRVCHYQKKIEKLSSAHEELKEVESRHLGGRHLH